MSTKTAEFLPGFDKKLILCGVYCDQIQPQGVSFLYYEFYIDQFAAEHFLSEYLLLVLTARVLGKKVSIKRLAAASAAGTAAMVLGICTGLSGWYPAGVLASAAAAFFRIRQEPGTVRNVQGAGQYGRAAPEDRIKAAKHSSRAGERRPGAAMKRDLAGTGLLSGLSEVIKGVCALLAVTVCFGGVLEVMTSLFGLPVLAGAAVSVLLAGAALEHRKQRQEQTAHIVTVQLCLGEKTRKVRALLDTGNRLCEPFTGRPVSIVQAAEAETLLEEDWEEKRGYLLIPYCSLGSGKSWMRGVKIDRMTIECADGIRSTEAPILAVYESRFSAGEDYQMILHPQHLSAGRA